MAANNDAQTSATDKIGDRRETPLFPLQSILYPSVSLPLQIFEQRYLRLVKESLAGGIPFGVVPIVEGREVGNTPKIIFRGTLVTIVDWSQQANGLLGIVIKGGQRFTVGETRVEADGLLLGEITLEAAEDPVPLAEEDRDLLKLLSDLARELRVEQYYMGDDLDTLALTWRLADLLPASKAQKMALYEMSDSVERLAEVRRWVLELQQR